MNCLYGDEKDDRSKMDTCNYWPSDSHNTW